ncbi:MAG: polyprenol monophosphomannose synthase [Flavobacteriaceae bacterium]|nr:polyprenol monophosphomannose synthase [Flavobacteriaceae bacterium]
MSQVLVIIPTYNESDNIKAIIDSLLSLELACDLLIVDDNSPDGTADIVRTFSHNSDKVHLLLRDKKQGIGKAYQDGFFWALNKEYLFVFQMDADFSHNPKEIPKMYNLLVNKCDVVVGSRYAKGISVVNWPLGRIILSLFASMYVRSLLDLKVKDPTSGFVGYKKEVLSHLAIREIKFVGYTYQIEMKYRSHLKGFSILEHPIIFINREYGKSKMNYKIIREAIFGVPYLRLYKSKFK